MADDDKTIPLHPLFVTGDDLKDAKPLAEPIRAVDMLKLDPDGVFRMKGWEPVSEGFPDETFIRRSWGGGTYRVIGRNIERSRILRWRVITLAHLDANGRAVAGAEEEPRVRPPPRDWYPWQRLYVSGEVVSTREDGSQVRHFPSIRELAARIGVAAKVVGDQCKKGRWVEKRERFKRARSDADEARWREEARRPASSPASSSPR